MRQQNIFTVANLFVSEIHFKFLKPHTEGRKKMDGFKEAGLAMIRGLLLLAELGMDAIFRVLNKLFAPSLTSAEVAVAPTYGLTDKLFALTHKKFSAFILRTQKAKKNKYVEE